MTTNNKKSGSHKTMKANEPRNIRGISPGTTKPRRPTKPINFRRPGAAIVYEGPSLLDGEPIVVVATWGSKNPKTGPMVQTWILRADVNPVEATQTGADESVCGNCKHRPANIGSCYVGVARAPLQVFKKYLRGGYARIPRAALAAFFRMAVVRLGSYGDPAAVPVWVWQAMVRYAHSYTGYTHQWAGMGARQATALKHLTMASADTQGEADAAREAGWRTFRVRRVDEPLVRGEMVCPASDEAGKKRTCMACTACQGVPETGVTNAFRGVAIIAHGATAVRFIRQQQQAAA